MDDCAVDDTVVIVVVDDATISGNLYGTDFREGREARIFKMSATASVPKRQNMAKDL